MPLTLSERLLAWLALDCERWDDASGFVSHQQEWWDYMDDRGRLEWLTLQLLDSNEPLNPEWCRELGMDVGGTVGDLARSVRAQFKETFGY